MTIYGELAGKASKNVERGLLRGLGLISGLAILVLILSWGVTYLLFFR